MLRSWFHKSFDVACVLLAAGCLTSASAVVQDRIAGSISTGSRQAIAHSVHPKVKAAADLGATAGSTRLEGMTVRFSMTPAQQAALDKLLADQQDPASPQYHQWLTPAQYRAQFGLSSADVAKVTTWLTSQGFTITEVANSGTFVRFNGTVEQAQAAFRTSIHNYSLNGEAHFANVTDAAVPAPLGSVVSAVTGLHNFRLRSRLRSRVVKVDALRPNFTSSISGNHFIAPGDFYTIYNESPALTNGLTGAGVSIAVMGQVNIVLSDVAAFRTAAGLSANVPSIKTYVNDSGNYGELLEQHKCELPYAEPG